MRLLADSSALAKRYIAEPGSAAVEACCGEATEIVLSAIAMPETISGLNRLRRAGRLGDEAYLSLKKEILADIDEVMLIGLTPAVLRSAIACLESVSIRTLDAIQVATAVEAGCDVFLSADRRQCRAAGSMGLRVVDLSALK